MSSQSLIWFFDTYFSVYFWGIPRVGTEEGKCGAHFQLYISTGSAPFSFPHPHPTSRELLSPSYSPLSRQQGCLTAMYLCLAKLVTASSSTFHLQKYPKPSSLLLTLQFLLSRCVYTSFLLLYFHICRILGSRGIEAFDQYVMFKQKPSNIKYLPN